MQQVIVMATLWLLVLAALVFAFQILLQLKRGSSRAGFPIILLVVIVGWITTEVVSDAFGTSLGDIGRWGHLSVMFLFAVTVTLQLRRARNV
jgi:formate hydrogenlyase subunit 3/multisubunit Na+/H+ antiporter MnhD subunit